MKFQMCAAGLSLSIVLVQAAAVAQTVDNTETLPNAKPGECYAKVITPARYTTQQETVVVQEASERIRITPAKYETEEQTVVVKEASQKVTVVPAVYESSSERVEVVPASNEWMAGGGKNQPASPAALDGIIRSGVDLATVPVGTCFREYYTPAEFKNETQQILVKASSEIITVVPAKYETVEERVIVKEASTQVVDVPAVYRTEKQQVLIEPAKSIWKKGRGLVERIDNTTGEIMCLVEIPARYETVNKTVLESPATTKTVEVPAVYKTIKVSRLVSPASERREPVQPKFQTVNKRVRVSDAGFYWLKKGESASGNAKYTGSEVCLTAKPAEYRTLKTEVLKSPATTRIEEVPAQYSTMSISRLITPASEVRVAIPEKTTVVNKRVEVSPSRLEWRAVLCETNMTPNIITDLQRALKREGYNPGPIDGVVGSDTKKALESYQLKNNLDRGGLTYESLKSLKVKP